MPPRSPESPIQRLKLGRRPADPARLARTIRLTLTGQVPDHPLVADHLSAVPAWCLGANDRFGTCGPCSVANSAILTWKYLVGEDITVTDEAIFSLYKRSGNPSFDPATGAGDGGVDLTVLLAEVVRNGLTITHADGSTEVAKAVCFASHAVGPETVHAVTSIFGGSVLGLDLDVAQQAQTDQGLWDYRSGSPPWGGHATVGGSYTSQSGAHQRDESLVTWAMIVGTTDAFLTHQLPEAYCLVWPATWANPAFQAGVDQAALAADYTAVTGRPFPLPVPPQPPQPPQPPVPPDPSVIHVDTADQALAAAIPHGWTTQHHARGNRIAAKAVADWLAKKGL